MKIRCMCGTLNNYTVAGLAKVKDFLENHCTYGVYGEEVGESGTPHLQIYFEMKTQMTYSAVNKKLGFKKGGEWIDLSTRHGTPEQAAGYCKKGNETEEVYPDGWTDGAAWWFTRPAASWIGDEWGTISNQGERKDLKRKIDEVISGDTTPDEICVEMPVFYHQYGRTLEKAWCIAMRKKWRTEMTTCDWLWGETGVGKSHKAFEGYSPETHYVWNLAEEFQCGYRQQDTVIINEFRGQIKYSELLTLIDKWPHCIKRKGGEQLPFVSKHIIITSCKPPDEIYPRQDEKDSLRQLLRRIKVIEVEKQPPVWGRAPPYPPPMTACGGCG
ncbi:MAG: helicase [Cressdnaviricota sp.]|nr:MAG: helicase [Cressdnaviricota sp.]